MQSTGVLLLAALTLATSPLPAGGGDAQWRNVAMDKKGGEPVAPAAASEQGFPLPAGARKNDALGGATSVAPGKNYTLTVYDVDTPLEPIVDFYAQHLPGATRVSEGYETRFTTARGSVKIAPLGKGARITFVIGPR